jgi:hypothetical protein
LEGDGVSFGFDLAFLEGVIGAELSMSSRYMIFSSIETGPAGAFPLPLESLEPLDRTGKSSIPGSVCRLDHLLACRSVVKCFSSHVSSQ